MPLTMYTINILKYWNILTIVHRRMVGANTPLPTIKLFQNHAVFCQKLCLHPSELKLLVEWQTLQTMIRLFLRAV